MKIQDIMQYVDHTLLAQTAAWDEIREVCDDGMKYSAASVCIPPSYVKRAKEYVQDRIAVCTVIGFPNGYQTTAVKAAEAKDAVENGADEIDMVINIGWVKDKRYDKVEEEIRQVKDASYGKLLKVIIETCLLTEEEKVGMCKAVTGAGADFIKTSTGFSTAGATLADVKLLAAHVGDHVSVKAAGGIASLKDAEEFIKAGAARLGTSRIVKLFRDEEAGGY